MCVSRPRWGWRWMVMLLTLMIAACGESPGNGGAGVPQQLTARDDSVGVTENQAEVIDVLANDSSPDEPLTISQITAATSGTVLIEDSGCCLRYIPASNFRGEDSFTYQVTDSAGAQAVATVNITVGPGPKVLDDTLDLFSGGVGAPILLSTLLANDATEGGSEFVAISTSASSAEDGILLLDTQGGLPLEQQLIRYTPAEDVSADKFVYTLTDAAGRERSATVNINLAAPAACDEQVAKRKASGLGWCYETYFDSFDAGADADGTGTNIAMQVFIPNPYSQRQLALSLGADLDATDNGFSPLLVHSHGFGGNKQEDFQFPEAFLDNQLAKSAWEAGYNVISYTQRGFGGTPLTDGDTVASGDSIGILAPNLEGFDFIRLVDWAICHLRVDAPLEEATAAEQHEVEANNCASGFNDAGSWGASMLARDDGTRLTGYDDDIALATVGYSYGGGFQFLAQSVDARVDAIMPMGTWHDLRFSLHPNDTPKFTWIEIMNQFAGTTPGLGGGNGQPLPAVLTDARTESNGVNLQTDDSPHNKARQVSVKNARILGPKGPVAWCYDNQNYYASKYNDSDGEPESLTAANPANTPAHLNVASRGARANLFMIQGYGDTLFNYNEGYDNARCFEDAGVEDVRLLEQTSGHPFPTVDGLVPSGVIPPHYAGQNTSMYLDEVVHCGVDEAGDPVRYNMVEVLQQWMDFYLLNGQLPEGVAGVDAIFPKACITQTNVDPDYQLSESDPFYNGSNSATTGFKFSREGVVFDSVAETPLGHSQYTQPDANQVDANGNFSFSDVNLVTGVVSGVLPLPTLVPLYEASRLEGEVLAGIPLAHLEVERSILTALIDEIFYVGVYVKRCQLDPDDTVLDSSGTPTNCDSSNTAELLHYQTTPVRVFPASTADALATSANYPKINPRNFSGDASKGAYYPLVAGYNPDTQRQGDSGLVNNSSMSSPEGRLLGVSARLYPGDEVGLALYAGHLAFATVASTPAGSVSVSGSVQLPLVTGDALSDAPDNEPDYFQISF